MDDIIQEATEAYEQGRDAGYAVGDLLQVIKNQKFVIDILIRKKKTLRDEIAEKDAEIMNLKHEIVRVYEEGLQLNKIFLDYVKLCEYKAYTELAEAVKKKLGVEKFSIIDNTVKELCEKGCG